MQVGNLSVAEIQNILKNQKEDVETDWIAGIFFFFNSLIFKISFMPF